MRRVSDISYVEFNFQIHLENEAFFDVFCTIIACAKREREKGREGGREPGKFFVISKTGSAREVAHNAALKMQG